MKGKLCISQLKPCCVEIPTIRPHKMAVATMQTQTLVLVKITTEDGYIGWGEATHYRWLRLW